MSYKKDIKGQRFGKLTVIEYAYNKKHNSYWKCKCDCGNEKNIMLNNLTRGMTKSCGCIRKQASKERMTIHGLSNTRANRLITYNNETYCLAEWEDITGIKAGVILARIDKLNWDIEEALTQPVR